MDHDVNEGRWKQFKGRVRERWGELSDDEIEEARGHLEILEGKLQEKYGMAKDEAREQLRRMEDNL